MSCVPLQLRRIASMRRTLLVATDADMVGTSYADGILHPLNGAHDAVSRVALDEKTS